MHPPIRIDPATGYKQFNTRAAKANDRIIGKGYSTIEDQALKTLPPPPPGAVFNAEEQARYREFKETRRGAADYMAMEGEFAKYLEDVYSDAPVERDALDDECEILVVGGGFGGLILWYKLRKAGFANVRFCEKGGDVGGTWYWNRYPGIACDVESYSYMPLLEEMGYFPTMKFASGFEILEYAQSMAERFEFYDRCLFHTTVEKTVWDEGTKRWTVHTDRGDAMKARFVVLANGILTAPRLARIDGMETYKGEAFHTSRWDYNVDLKGKRVGIIGTGATAVQVIPEIAKVVGELHVFQRTPSSIDVRDQRVTEPQEIEQWKKETNWALNRRNRLKQITSGRAALLGDDDFLSGKAKEFKPKKKHLTPISPEELVQKQLNSSFRVMEQIRGRVDAVVDDPETAKALRPYYPYGCKRPTFHDEFLPAFNLPNVHLVDTAPHGVQQINETGILHDGKQYDLDVLIYATGFQWMGTSSFNMVVGREGKTLREKWETEGVKTFLGIHSNGFPNLFIMSGPQGGGGQFNFIVGLESHTDYVTWMLEEMRKRGAGVVDVKKEPEVSYASHCKEADMLTSPLRDCLSYYNGDGTAEPGSLAYYGGPQEWHRRREDAQASMDVYMFEGAP
ncbi:MAG: Neopentalenolactone D synthase [Alphaproteobacteria bacterium MarineAlpha4_Bin2]|nr:MAG: Neopentalenolactone D synthase [Alphaproteobacteria bacterium MarineAlpha4_Bin2]